MIRTVKLSYAAAPQASEIIAQWRKAQSVVIRTAYNRVREGKKDKEILDLLRTMPQGKLDSWLTLSALKRARALHRASPLQAVIFGGKRNLQLRSQGKITAQEWKAKRRPPLYFEGHAKSHGEQGGNHRFVLDIEHNTIWFYAYDTSNPPFDDPSHNTSESDIHCKKSSSPPHQLYKS